MTEFIVITGLPQAPNGGNLAAVLDLWVEEQEPHPDNGFEGVYRELAEVDPNLAVAALLRFRQPVFQLGEIIVAEDGREIGGNGRKPNKWLVDTETFSTVEEAVACARRVT